MDRLRPLASTVGPLEAGSQVGLHTVPKQSKLFGRHLRRRQAKAPEPVEGLRGRNDVQASKLQKGEGWNSSWITRRPQVN